MNKFLILFCIAGLMSCNGGCNESSSTNGTSTIDEVSHENFIPPAPKEQIGKNIDIEAVVARKGGKLGQACTLVPLNLIAEALGKTPQEVTRRNATPADADPAQTACFYKWSDFDIPNAGIFIQLLRNPLGDEYPNYVSLMIESKRNKGEQSVNGSPIHFKRFEGFGDDGSYSTDGGKYFWRLGEEVVFHIAFNTSHGPQEQYQIATTLAKLMTENYLK